MVGLIESSWLFIRGRNSVRLVRVATEDGALHLRVQGPGNDRLELEFHDVIECMTHQADLERRLMTQGYSLQLFNTERRQGRLDRRAHPRSDRRMP